MGLADNQVEMDVLDFVYGIETVNDLENLIGSFDKLIQKYGYEYFRCAEILRCNNPLDPYVAFGEVDLDWCERYKEKRYVFSDSTIQLGLRSKYPFAWSDVKNKKRISSVAKRIFEEADIEFGYKDGLVVPIHMENGSISMFSIIGEKPDISDQVRRGLGMAAVYMHSKARNLAIEDADISSVKAKTAVSRRQLDCIQWVAEGKSDWEISRILGISESTVHNHIEAAKKNLAVRTRVQAVVEATRRRLIVL